jgi:hypothetical protein
VAGGTRDLNRYPPGPEDPAGTSQGPVNTLRGTELK